MNERKPIYQIRIDVFDEGDRTLADTFVGERAQSRDQWRNADPVQAVVEASGWAVKQFRQEIERLSEER